MPKLLLVEDEPSIAEGLTITLEAEGFQVVWVKDGGEAVPTWERVRPDIILLDLMLPGMSGTEVCRIIRSRSDVPIIMLTARDQEVDRVVGLELGADDYVTKPFSTRELVARVRAVLRRAPILDVMDVDAPAEASGVRVDRVRHEVQVDGELVELPPKEFELLAYLVENAGRVLTRHQLIDEVWGTDYVGDTKTLDVHIRRLRTRVEAGRRPRPSASRPCGASATASPTGDHADRRPGRAHWWRRRRGDRRPAGHGSPASPSGRSSASGAGRWSLQRDRRRVRRAIRRLPVRRSATSRRGTSPTLEPCAAAGWSTLLDAQQELLDRERRWRDDLVHSLVDAALVFDAQGYLIAANRGRAGAARRWPSAP